MLLGKIPDNGHVSDEPSIEYEVVNLQSTDVLASLPELEKDLLLKLLESDIDKRLSADDALKHNYF